MWSHWNFHHFSITSQSHFSSQHESGCGYMSFMEGLTYRISSFLSFFLSIITTVKKLFDRYPEGGGFAEWTAKERFFFFFFVSVVGYVTCTGDVSPCTWPPVNVLIERVVRFINIVLANDANRACSDHWSSWARTLPWISSTRGQCTGHCATTLLCLH